MCKNQVVLARMENLISVWEEARAKFWKKARESRRNLL